jgi:multisubunit Na+/H+ antiporter MnhE subunit
MTTALLRLAGLMAVYVLVLTSVAPGDLLVAAVLGAAVLVWLRPRAASGPGAGAAPSAIAAVRVVCATAAEMARGSWRVARFCLGRPYAPGFVEIPRGDRSRVSVAFWGVLTGEAPDEVVVDVDEARDVLITHLVDASDPDGVRARHRAQESTQKAVVR